MATDAVSRNPLFLALVEELRNSAETFTIGCTRLVEHCEAGEFDGPAVEATLHGYIDPLLAQGVDTLVLGCTHFPLLRPAIEQVAGPSVTIIDSGIAVARQARHVLEERQMLRESSVPSAMQSASRSIVVATRSPSATSPLPSLAAPSRRIRCLHQRRRSSKRRQESHGRSAQSCH